jgi:hypothetical protein
MLWSSNWRRAERPSPYSRVCDLGAQGIDSTRSPVHAAEYPLCLKPPGHQVMYVGRSFHFRLIGIRYFSFMSCSNSLSELDRANIGPILNRVCSRFLDFFVFSCLFIVCPSWYSTPFRFEEACFFLLRSVRGEIVICDHGPVDILKDPKSKTHR